MALVLSEASEQLPPSASARDIAAGTEAARLAGCRIYTIPPDFERCGDAEGALAHVPPQETPTPTFWIGYIPTPERYAALYAAAQTRNLILPNTPEEHRNAQEFDHAYPLLGSLTPASAILTRMEEAAASVEAVGGFPVFVKGAIQSRKSRGRKACVAENAAELDALIEALLTLENRSRGRVVVRRLARLRHIRTGPGDFPLGREFRVFLYKAEIVGLGYYWEGDDPLAHLTAAEDEEVRALATEAACRVGAPYIAVDIGQEENGNWLVIGLWTFQHCFLIACFEPLFPSPETPLIVALNEKQEPLRQIVHHTPADAAGLSGKSRLALPNLGVQRLYDAGLAAFFRANLVERRR